MYVGYASWPRDNCNHRICSQQEWRHLYQESKNPPRRLTAASCYVSLTRAGARGHRCKVTWVSHRYYVPTKHESQGKTLRWALRFQADCVGQFDWTLRCLYQQPPSTLDSQVSVSPLRLLGCFLIAQPGETYHTNDIVHFLPPRKVFNSLED